MGTSFLALDACGASIHTSPEKVKKKPKNKIKTLKKTKMQSAPVAPTMVANPGPTTNPAAAVFVQGQEPLTASMLAQAPPSEQKQMLGERLFPLIQGLFPDMAGKITGMLLEIDNSELVHMLEHKESLSSKVEEAVAVLSAHKTTPE